MNDLCDWIEKAFPFLPTFMPSGQPNSTGLLYVKTDLFFGWSPSGFFVSKGPRNR